MQIGRKIYYEKANGIVIWDKGEMTGDVIETTLEQDIQTMPVIGLLDSEQLGILQLAYGELVTSFNNCRGYKINTIDGTVQFIEQEV